MSGEALAYREAFAPLDAAEVGVHEDSRTGVTDAVEIRHSRQRARLAVAPARDTNSAGGARRKEIDDLWRG